MTTTKPADRARFVVSESDIPIAWRQSGLRRIADEVIATTYGFETAGEAAK